MILILFLIVGFISITFEQRNLKICGHLPKNKILSVYENGVAYYLVMSEYSNDNYLDINVTVYSGHFTENIMFYGASDEIIATGRRLPIPYNWTLTNYEEGDKIDDNNYNNYTFIIRCPVYAVDALYLYISVPYFSGSHADIIVNYKPSEPSDSSGSDSIELSLAAVIGIVAGVVILIIIIIIVCCVRRSKRKNYQSDYMKPVAPNVNVIIPSVNTPTPVVNTYAAPVNNYPSNVPLETTSIVPSVTYEPAASPVYIPPASPVYMPPNPNNFI